MSHEIRVRFAPSPTGPLHIGGVRTALYNFLFAKRNSGKFILRIEDTDKNRYVPGAETYIHETLRWLSILPDEGPETGGPCAPYRQSERKTLYLQFALKLVEEGKAYYAFDTPEELESMRKRLTEEGMVKPQYNAITRMSMDNSLVLSPGEVQEKIKAGFPHVIRLKVPPGQDIRFRDEIRDWVHVNSDTIDDKIILKSDGMPTYHLANIVDDHEMKITHVIRGEEWLPSAPLHVLMYDFFGWKSSMPKFAHLPLILKTHGEGKLSKRDGDKHGFPVFPLDWTDPLNGEKSSGFREQGYLPEAMINFLALLGWNPGTDQELFNRDGLIKIFSLERINKSGARFDIEKARWINQQYLKDAPTAMLGDQLMKDLHHAGIVADKSRVERVADAFRERITYANDIYPKSLYFFSPLKEYDESVIKKCWTRDTVEVLQEFAKRLKAMSNGIKQAEAGNILTHILDIKNVGKGKVMQALRLAVTGVGDGIDLMLTIEILGAEEVSKRIELALYKLTDKVQG